VKVFGFIFVAIIAGIALHGRPRSHPVRLRPARHRPVAVGGGRQRRRREAHGRLLAADLRRGRRPGRHAQLLGGSTRSYSLDFPAGLGFTGIAIALLGRNNAIGMALSALLFSFLDSSSIILDFNGISKEIVLIMQGTIVLSVVVVYELVRRYGWRPSNDG
jgi:simple sugar transport system permease protein